MPAEFPQQQIEQAQSMIDLSFEALSASSVPEVVHTIEIVRQGISDNQLLMIAKDQPVPVDFRIHHQSSPPPAIPALFFNPEQILSLSDQVERNVLVLSPATLASSWMEGTYARRRSFSFGDSLAVTFAYLESEGQDITTYFPHQENLISSYREKSSPWIWEEAVRDYLEIKDVEYDIGHDVFCDVLDSFDIYTNTRLRRMASNLALPEESVDDVIKGMETYYQQFAANLKDPIIFQYLREDLYEVVDMAMGKFYPQGIPDQLKTQEFVERAMANALLCLLISSMYAGLQDFENITKINGMDTFMKILK